MKKITISAPAISRFVAPWDTSGWYTVAGGLKVGSRVRTNGNIRIKALPEEFEGAEFIQTFDSLLDGFDDKEGMDLYLECGADLYIAADPSYIPEAFSEFTDTGKTVSLSDGVTYRVLKKRYGDVPEEGLHVSLPKLTDGNTAKTHHYFAFAKPCAGRGHSLYIDELPAEGAPSETKGEYYAQDDFSAVSDAVTYNDGTVCDTVPFPFDNDKSLRVSGKGCACARYALPKRSGKVCIRMKVKTSDSSISTLPEVLDERGGTMLRVVMFKNNLYATDGGRLKRLFGHKTPWMYYPCDNIYYIKLDIDTENGLYSLWVDGALRLENAKLTKHGGDMVSSLLFATGGECYINSVSAAEGFDFCSRDKGKYKLFNVRDFGAKGDGRTLDTKAIEKAVIAAAKVKNGAVYLDRGTFLSGTVRLLSGVTLWVERGAVLKGTQNHKHYPLVTPGNSLCAARQLGRGLVYAENAENIRVTGGGMLDGSGLYRFKMNDPLNNRNADARPDIIYITYSKNVRVDNINLRSSGFWSLVPLSCENVTIEHVDLDCMNTPNRDGIDPVDCKNITVRHCRIMAGDDGLCFKSSDVFGCENIECDDIMIQSLASGIKFGTDTYYSLKHAVFRNCVIKNVNRCGVSLETVDGAEVNDVLFENIYMSDVGAPVYVTVGARNRLPRNKPPVRRSFIDGVIFRRIRFEHPYPFSFEQEIRECMVIGQSEQQKIKNITFEKCRFALPGGVVKMPDPPHPINDKYPEYDRHGLSSGYAFTFMYTENARVKDCEITLDKPDVRPESAVF